MRTLSKLAALCILACTTFTFSQEPSLPRIDLNAAPKDQLLTLEGVDAAIADKIIAGRPYKKTEELIDRKILPAAVYDKIQKKLSIGPEIQVPPKREQPIKIADESR